MPSDPDINNQQVVNSEMTAAELNYISPVTTKDASSSLTTADIGPDLTQSYIHEQDSYAAIDTSIFPDGYGLCSGNSPVAMQSETASHGDWTSIWNIRSNSAFDDSNLDVFTLSPLDTGTHDISPAPFPNSSQPKARLDSAVQNPSQYVWDQDILPAEVSLSRQSSEPQSSNAPSKAVPASISESRAKLQASSGTNNLDSERRNTIQYLDLHPEDLFAFQWYLSSPLMSESKYIELYFSRFHPHWPILHRSTFKQSNISEELLRSVLLIGAWFSDDESAKSWATSLYSSVTDTLRSHIVGTKSLVIKHH